MNPPKTLATLLPCALILVAAPQSHSAVMVSNLGNGNSLGIDTVYDDGPPPSQSGVGMKFTTGSSAVMLDSVEFTMLSGTGSSGFSVGLYTSSGAVPGTLVETLTGSAAPVTSSSVVGSYSYAGSSLLASNTTYWLVTETTQIDANRFRIWATGDLSETSSSGWTIDDDYYLKDINNVWSSGGGFYSVKLAVNGTVVPEPTVTANFAALGALMILRRRRRR